MQEFDRFMEVVRELRKKCPWDSVQTHESLKPYLMEEAGEVLEGIDHLNAEGDSQNLCEELGDVLFQVALHSVIAEEEGLFTIKDVISGVESKMKFRHPKIFSPEDKQLAGLSWDAEAVSLSWDELKARERQKKSE